MRQRLQALDHFGPEAAIATARRGVYHHPTADGDAWRKPAQDETITAHQGDRSTQSQLCPACLAGGQSFNTQQPRPSRHLGRATEKVHLGVVLERSGSVGQIMQLHVDKSR